MRSATIKRKTKETDIEVTVNLDGSGVSNIATGIALCGHKTIAIDFDVGLRNLDLVMGCERRVVYDIINVIKGEAKLQQAIIRDKRVENLYMLPASQTRDKDALDPEGVGRVLETLKEMGHSALKEIRALRAQVEGQQKA